MNVGYSIYESTNVEMLIIFNYIVRLQLWPNDYHFFNLGFYGN